MQLGDELRLRAGQSHYQRITSDGQGSGQYIHSIIIQHSYNTSLSYSIIIIVRANG